MPKTERIGEQSSEFSNAISVTTKRIFAKLGGNGKTLKSLAVKAFRNFNFILLRILPGFTSIAIPSMRTTITGEDLSTTN